MPVYSVSQVARYLKDSLERDSLLRDLWISGEVSNLSVSGAGHVYFTIKDEAGALRCAMFRPAKGSDLLSNGAAVLAHGRVSFYEVRGDIQYYVDIVQPEGVGELHLLLEQLKLKLEKEGLFEPSRKRPLPTFPKRIGLVTSPTGAVFHDIQNVLKRRYPLVELALAPTKVQGDGAAEGIIEALDVLNDDKGIDVIILARGGGSMEELQPFNEESVAYAIYGSRVPVISGVGHETDVTIADLVADHRAPTPSAAAELAVPDRLQLAAQVLASEQSLVDGMSRRLTQLTDDMGRLYSRLENRAPDVTLFRLRIDDMLRDSSAYIDRYLSLKRERLQSLDLRLASLSPGGVLSRGYAIVQKEDSQEVVRRVGQVKEGEAVQVTISDGGFGAEVTSSHLEQQENPEGPVSLKDEGVPIKTSDGVARGLVPGVKKQRKRIQAGKPLL